MKELEPGWWRQRGSCWDTFDPRFFPNRGQSTRWAKRMCSECPVSKPCLEDAIKRREPAGIRGEMSTRERRAIIKQRAQNEQA